MNNISVSDRDQRRGIDALSSACNHLLATYTRGPSWIDPDAEAGFWKLLEIAKGLQLERLVPVYRRHQPTTWSKCLFGEPCAVCAPHKDCKVDKRLERDRGLTDVRFYDLRCKLCRRGNRPECPLVEPAPPAFTVTKVKAIKLVRLGFAEFVNGKRALRLTFSNLAGLRGGSVNIDEAFLMNYAQGKKFAVEVIDGQDGWRKSATARVFTTKWPVIYGEACCAWPPSVNSARA
jgi:hypothetical protein